MKDFLLTQVMTPEQVKYAVDNCVIGHTAKDGEHVTVVRQWRLKADGVFTNDQQRVYGGRWEGSDIKGNYYTSQAFLRLVHPQSDGKLTDGMISRVHFSLKWLPIDDEVTIKDSSSTNGTFVNGHKLKTLDLRTSLWSDGTDNNREHLLKDGDEILVGETRLLFEEVAYKK